MPPKLDRAEAAFDAVQAQLDAVNVGSWQPQEMEVFLSLLETYYTQLRTQKTLAKRKGLGNDAPDPEDGSGSAAEDDEEDVEALEHEAAVAEVDRALAKLRDFLQRKVPFGSIQEPSVLPYETADKDADIDGAPANATDKDTNHPTQKKPRKELATTSCAASVVKPVVYSIDAFLYLEEHIEELTEQGAISRHYCADCGSTNLAPTDFITHSFSQDQLIFLSCFLLPALGEEAAESGLSTRVVVDVGSRLGIALWSCYFAAQQHVLQKTERLIGIELDSRFAALQRETGKKFCPRPVPLLSADAADANAKKKNHNKSPKGEEKCLTWSIVESDCFTGDGAKAMAEAGVVILHNVFEYFCESEEEHLRCWLKLRSLVKRTGQVLICAPSIEETMMAFSEEALEACGILAKEDGDATSATGEKRARRDTEDAEEFPPPGRKELAVARWIADYLEPIEDEVEQLAEDFIAFRTAMLEDGDDDHHHHAASDDDDAEDEEDEQEVEGAEHGKGCSDGCCEDDGCCGDHGEKEPSELEEQIRNIWVYKVK